MVGFAFAAFFTVVATILAAIAFAHGGWLGLFVLPFPAIGIWMMRDAHAKAERLESLRTETGEDGYLIYVWTEDGREMRSLMDPRPGWEADGSDA